MRTLTTKFGSLFRLPLWVFLSWIFFFFFAVASAQSSYILNMMFFSDVALDVDKPLNMRGVQSSDVAKHIEL